LLPKRLCGFGKFIFSGTNRYPLAKVVASQESSSLELDSVDNRYCQELFVGFLLTRLC
jgi:hypothetical protein